VTLGDVVAVDKLQAGICAVYASYIANSLARPFQFQSPQHTSGLASCR
jgi:hypothetical protein